MPEIQVKLKSAREARKLSASELAKRVGVSRQTIYAIEDGSFVPNTTIALRLSRELEVPVEKLFSLSDTSLRTGIEVEAEILTSSALRLHAGQSVRLCSVGNRKIAVPVSAVSNYLPEADGVLESSSGGRLRVRCFMPVSEKDKTLVIAGCDPALSFVEQSLEASGFQVVIVPCSSRKALDWLKEGRVHVAGSHLQEPASGEHNVAIVKRLFPKGGVRIVTFAGWEEGLVIKPGNPKNIRSIADLPCKEVTLMNREKGSGSRALLDSRLAKAKIPTKAVTGYERIAAGHLPVAYEIARGVADCCIATQSAARCFGLDFVPLATERFDFVITTRFFESRAGIALLELLNASRLRRKLQTIAGYDVSQTGSVVM